MVRFCHARALRAVASCAIGLFIEQNRLLFARLYTSNSYARYALLLYSQRIIEKSELPA